MGVTPILEIEEIAPTQLDKTTTMNDGLVAMEAAGNAQLVVDFTAGNQTLTFTEYSRNAFFAAESLAADSTLTVPQTTPTGHLAAYREFGVRNFSSSHTLTVGGTTGFTVTIPPSSGAVIQNDGTNCWVFGSGGPGPAGPPGGGISIEYQFNTATSNADPGAGFLALNNATQNTATAIYVEDVDTFMVNWLSVLQTIDASSSTVKGQLRIFEISNPANWLTFHVTARTSHTNYQELTVTVIGSSATNPFTLDMQLGFTFTRTGDAGAGSTAIGAGNLIANLTSGSAIATGVGASAFLDFNFGSVSGEMLVRQGSSWTATQTVAITGGSITGMPSPSNPTDVATKQYVDITSQGLQQKPTATWTTAAALPTNTYANGTLGVGATLTATSNGALTVDGGTVALNDLVLVMTEVTQAHNGLYVQTQVGDGSHPYILTRSIDMDQATEFDGAFIPTGPGGTLNANTLWLCETTGTVVVGTTAITFVQLNGATSLFVSGSGINLSGNTLTVEWNAGTVDVVAANQMVVSGNTLAFITGPTVIANQGTSPMVVNSNTSTAYPTIDPNTALLVVGKDSTSTMTEKIAVAGTLTGNSGNAGNVYGRLNGSLASPTALASGDRVYAHNIRGHDGTTYAGAISLWNILAAGAWTGSSHPLQQTWGYVASGATVVTEGMRLTDLGALLIGTTAATGSEKLNIAGLALVSSININSSGSIQGFDTSLGINSGTISVDSSGTVTLTGTTPVTITPSNGVTNYIVNNGTATGTLAIASGLRINQELLLKIVNGATPFPPVLPSSSFNFGSDVTAYAGNSTANDWDYVKAIWNGSKWDVVGFARTY